MSTKRYYVLYCGEDGPSIESLDEETITKRLVEEHYGNVIFNDLDLQNGPPKLLIFKGPLVTPKAKKTVTEFELED